MDKMEQKLQNYYQYHCAYQPEAISGEFLQRLKALESVPEAKRPRRRYLLPVAAAAALAVCLGSVWAWQHFSRPEDTQTPDVTLEEPVSEAAAHPALPTEVGRPEAKEPKSPKPQTPDQADTESPASLTKPGQGGTAQPNFGDPAPVLPEGAPSETINITPQGAPGIASTEKPQYTTPIKPEGPAPVRPDDPAPVTPNGEAPAETVVNPSANPDDEQSGKPDDPDPPEPEDPNPPDPPETDPPDAPQIPPEIGIIYLKEGERETLALTLLSTGENAEIDITGLYPLFPQTPTDLEPLGETPAQAAGENQTFIGGCSAFGWEIAYTLTRTGKTRIVAEAFAIRETDQTEKGESHET